jgi:hypothetical protein
MPRTCDGQVAGHEVHVVGQVLPGAAHAGHLRLAAQLAFGAHFARHPRHFAGERVELVHHGVDGVLQLQDLALHVHRDLLGQVAARHGLGHVGDVAHLDGQVGRPSPRKFTLSVRSFQVPATPCTTAWPPSLPFGAHFARHPRHFGGEGAQLVHHRVDGVLQLEDLALHVHRDLLGQVAGATAVVTSAMLRTWPSGCRP